MAKIEKKINEQQQPVEDLRIKMQNFLMLLSRTPDTADLAKTPDGKAFYLPIDFVETSLDELFFGQWHTDNFKWQVLQNELIGSIELTVLNPVSGQWIKRTGAASYTIMVDALSDSMKATMTPQERNAYAINVLNKKPNALDQGFPKLKSDCIKNAALSLGNIFGRNINRKLKDLYTPLIKLTKEDIEKQLTETANGSSH